MAAVNNIHDNTVSSAFAEANQTLYGYNYPTTPYTSLTPYQPQCPHPTPANPPPPFTLPPPSPQNNILDRIDERLNSFMIGVNQKLAKLDILDELNQRLSKIEKHCETVDKDISEIKHELQQQGGRTDTCLKQNSELYSRVEGIENENRWLKDENWKLREKGIESQTRSMRENLIIKGIPHVDNYREPENTEEKVKRFISEVLEIKDDIKFHVVHRLKPRPDKKPRNIIAKFERRKDRNNVLEQARKKLKENNQFVVHEQYPMEVIERRKQLIPIMLDARSKNHTATLRDDKLYIDGRRYFPPPTHTPPVNQHHVAHVQ